MIDLEFYKEHYKVSSYKDLYAYFLSTIVESNKTWEYFVDWDKVKKNVKKVETALNLLNSIVGKSNIRNELRELIKQYPEVVDAIPILVATREPDVNVIDFYESEIEEYHFSFTKKSRKKVTSNSNQMHKNTDMDIDKILEFCDRTGITDLLSGNVKNLVDYVFGVEVGMDTNARKNRSGKILEFFLEKYFSEMAKSHPELVVISQCNVAKINEKIGLNIKLRKRANKKFDFVFYNSHSGKLFFIESNFYNVSGSKPDAISGGDFEVLADAVKRSIENAKFIWITDGKGWKNSRQLLENVFTKESPIDYVFNIKMIKDGLLEKLLLSR